MVEKTCNKCNKSGDESLFTKQNTCKDCNNARRREKLEEKRKNLNSAPPAQCTLCKATKPATDFKVGCAMCRKCEALKKKERLKRVAENLPDTIICKKCDSEQSSSNFRLGEHVCNTCQKENLYKWRENNQDQFKSICDKYRSKDSSKVLANAYKRDTYNNDIQEKTRRNNRLHLRTYVFKEDDPSHKKFKPIIGCTRTHMRDWLEYNFKPDMTWDNYGATWNLDHVKPCSSFDLTDEDQLYKCFNWKNTMPIYCKQNLEKFNKVDDKLIEFYKTQAELFQDKTIQFHIRRKKTKAKKAKKVNNDSN